MLVYAAIGLIILEKFYYFSTLLSPDFITRRFSNELSQYGRKASMTHGYLFLYFLRFILPFAGMIVPHGRAGIIGFIVGFWNRFTGQQGRDDFGSTAVE